MEQIHTVLVVDDEPDARETLSTVLERAGITCITAGSGPEALTALRAAQPDVIIADHDMLGMDGVELLKLVATRYPGICRILLTARRDAEVAVRAINVGHAYRLLAKPCRTGDLLTTLHFAFESAEHEAETRRLSGTLRRQAALIAELRRRYPEAVEEIEARQPAVA
ncbi:MAG: response regulator [Myxococcales bacterium]